MTTQIDASLRQRLTDAQREEITEHDVYEGLARRESDAHNRQVLAHIAADEGKHYEFWAKYTGQHPPRKSLTVWAYLWLARLLGLTFAVKLMERNERRAQAAYARVVETIPEAAAVLRDEETHESELTSMIDEERMRYVGSTVLGLSDALVELTGALAGFTLALQHTRVIATIGLITGVAAALSMAASEYLSSKAEKTGGTSPSRAALYTGVAYIITVMILVAPYLILASPLLSLGLTLAGALVIILAFTYYVSVAQDLRFAPRFAEMAVISLGVAAVSFAVGYALRVALGVNV